MDRNIPYDSRLVREQLRAALKSGNIEETRKLRNELYMNNDEYQIDLFFSSDEKAELNKIAWIGRKRADFGQPFLFYMS